MGISVKTITTAVCDLCDEAIDTENEFVDAGVYGATFHIDCLRPYDPLVKALGLDDIRFYQSGMKYRINPLYTHSMRVDK